MPNCKFCGRPVTVAAVFHPECLEQLPGVWISVEESLPKNESRREDYLITVERSHFPTSSYDPCDAPYSETFVMTAQYDRDQKLWHLNCDEVLNALLSADDAPLNGDRVTHWMELPKPAREG